MNELIPVIAASPLRQRLIDDMTMRRFSRETQRNYIRDVGRFAERVAEPLGSVVLRARDVPVTIQRAHDVPRELGFVFDYEDAHLAGAGS